MAYIVSTLQTAVASGAATYTVNFPTGSGAPVANDTIVVLLTQDGSTESLGVGTSGFTVLGTQVEAGGNAGTSCLPFFKISTGGETSASFACSTAAVMATAIVIRDAHATAPFGSVTDAVDYKRVEWNVANFADSPNGASALTTAVNECLLLYMFCCDGTGYMRCKLSEVVEVDKFIGTASGHIIGCNQQQTAGVAPTVRMLHNTAAEGGNAWVLAVRNKTGGALQPMPRATATDIKYYGSWAAQHDAVTWQTPSNFSVLTAGAFTIGNKYTILTVGTTDFTLIGASANTVGVFFTATGAGTGTGTAGEAINSIYVSGATPTVDNTNFWTATGATHGAQTRISTTVAAEAWGGATHTISSTDMTGKVFSFEWARTAVSSASINGTAGQLVAFSDGTNWGAYQVASKAKSWAASAPDRAFVALDTATPYATGGTWDATAKAAITRIGYFAHISGAGTAAMEIKNAMLFDDVALTGGGSSRPAKFLDYQSYINSWSIYRAGLIQGSSQILCYQGLQIGDGTNGTYFDGAAQSLEYPQAWSATSNSNWQMNWNAGDNSVGLSVYAKAGDTINLASGVAATDSAQNLSINASSAADGDANYSFAQSFVGWRDPIDNKGLGWAGATFKECGTVTISGGGDLTNCTISNTTSTNAALSITANSTTITTSTISRLMNTGASATYHVSLGASVTATTWNGTTLSDGTPKIYSALVSGTLTITTDGLGTALVDADVTFIGGSTAVAVIAAPELYQSVTVSGAIANSQIHVADVDYTLTVSGITITPTAGATYTHNDITWTVVSASITAGSGAIVVYGLGSPAASGTLTKASGTGDSSVAFSAFVRNVTTLYNGAPTFPYTWTDGTAAAAARAIRLRVGYCQTTSARTFIESYIGVCGITDGTEAISYNASQVADTTYNTHALDGPSILALGEITVSDLGTDLITVDTAGGTMGWPTIYAAFVAWMASSSGIDDEIAYCDSPDPVNFIWENTRIKCPIGTALSVTDGWGRDSVTGLSITLWDNTGGAIGFSADHGIGYSTGSGLTTAQNAKLMALPAAIDIAEEVVNGITF